MKTTPITIQTTVPADAQKAWDLYTQPEHITQWNFASDEWHCPSAQSDLRPGGTYSSRMEAKDGSFGFDFGGTFDEVVPHSRISSTLGDGRQVVTTFEPAEEGSTTVTTSFEPENQNPHDMQQAGWQVILDNYKKHVERS